MDAKTLNFGKLYEACGYLRYRMSRFEEYDLYVRNKDFLVSDQVITFTDRSGRLLALKPDVTLSIIKNSDPAGEDVRKVYYKENVYRVDDNGGFREITQVGLECIGDIGLYEITETVALAVKSLAMLGRPYALELSHMGLVGAVLDASGLPDREKAGALRCLQQKNAHELMSLCQALGADPEGLLALLREDLKALEPVLRTEREMDAWREFTALWKALEGCGAAEHIRVDFSVCGDMKYYSGAVFKGYVEGIPSSVLSGGQYDRLLEKMGRKGGAIGFAIYASSLERLSEEMDRYDVDTVLLYDGQTDPAQVYRMREELARTGSVLAAKGLPKGITWRRLMKMKDGEAVTVEDNG